MTTTEEDFSDFVLRHSRRLQVIAMFVTGDADRGCDLVQEVLVRCYPTWQRIAGSADPFPYVRRAVLNASTSWFRRWSRETPRWAIDRGSLPDPTRGSADRMVLQAALAQLTVKERCVIVLRFYEDLSEADTAEALGMARGSVKSTTHRALGKLRANPDVLTLMPERS